MIVTDFSFTKKDELEEVCIDSNKGSRRNLFGVIVNLSTFAPIIDHRTVMAFAVVHTEHFTFVNVKTNQTMLDAQP